MKKILLIFIFLVTLPAYAEVVKQNEVNSIATQETKKTIPQIKNQKITPPTVGKETSNHCKIKCDLEVSSDDSALSKHLWDLAKIAIAFLLTGVCGGWITSQFQKQNWNHQSRVLKQQRYDDQATKIFEDISKILDKRTFRYRQIIYAFRSGNIDRIDKAFEEYRMVLFEWNDQINRNYSMIEKFFGKEMRENLEYKINSNVIFIGTLLERIKHGKNGDIGVEDVWKKVDDINAQIYRFDLKMLEAISKKAEEIT